jgi:hypothetical protein
MADYQEFKDAMDTLEAFIEKTETKDIDGEVHITIDDENVNEFMEIMQGLIAVATSDDNYVDEILEYLSELDKKITDKNMIAKFIPMFAALHSLATATKLPETTTEVKLDDWVFELSNMGAPLDARIGKVVDIIRSDEGVLTTKIKAPLANEIVEWEDAVFVVLPEMEPLLKKYQEKYTKTF